MLRGSKHVASTYTVMRKSTTRLRTQTSPLWGEPGRCVLRVANTRAGANEAAPSGGTITNDPNSVPAPSQETKTRHRVVVRALIIGIRDWRTRWVNEFMLQKAGRRKRETHVAVRRYCTTCTVCEFDNDLIIVPHKSDGAIPCAASSCSSASASHLAPSSTPAPPWRRRRQGQGRRSLRTTRQTPQLSRGRAWCARARAHRA